MGVLNNQNNDKKLTPDMAGYRPDPQWWPDLTAYRKAILLHRITFDEIDALLKEYAQICADKNKVACDFCYTALPDDKDWIYVEFPTFENVPHYLSLWNYQNLMVWFSQKADRQFCLAVPMTFRQSLFLSIMDQKNPHGDSCMGIYEDRDFYFEIPGDVFEWGPVPTTPFNYRGFLKEAFAFDTQWIPKVDHCPWKKTQVVLNFP
ncbi:MAG: hypothetical protein K2O99_09025 [Lachnospiraceae bacterium]|nr:hypothetical protein [Lachnospiraceae bacterium]